MPSLHAQLLLLPAVLVGALSCQSWGQQAIGDLYATDASVKGSVILAGSGTSVVSGSAIQAGAQAATLRLERGGTVLVCPGTNLNITASQNGRALLFSVNTGNLELDYPLGASADSLLTPDFRIVLPGPGRLHAAMRVTPQGDTCVQTLPSNSTAMTVYEAIGDESYQVKDNEAVLFKAGQIKGVLPANQNCGCPAPPPRPAAQAQVAKTETPPPSAAVQNQIAKANPPSPPVTLPHTEGGPQEKSVVTPLPITPSPNEHITLEAPFVFHGDDPYPNLTANVASLKIENNQLIQLEPVVLPPKAKQPKLAASQTQTSAATPERKRGFFASLGSFFASIFGK